MAAPRELARLQEWMLAAVTHAQGPEGPGGAPPIEAAIRPGRRQTSVERLAVYANAYYARLLQCLRELFPATRAALGEELFDDFAYGYLQAHPPHSYTLGRLADHFVEYLEQTRQEDDEVCAPDDARGSRRARRTEYGAEKERASTEGGDSAPPPCSPWRPGEGQSDFAAWGRFIVELARFEQVIDEVFDGPGLEGRPAPLAEQLAQSSADDLAAARLTLSPSLRLLQCAFPVNDYFTAHRRGERPEAPRPAATYVAVYRRDYAVRRQPLTAAQFELLTALGADRSIAEAVEGLGPELASAGGAEALRAWFAEWAEAGWFASLRSNGFDSLQEYPDGKH